MVRTLLAQARSHLTRTGEGTSQGGGSIAQKQDELGDFTKGEVDAPLTSVMGMKRRQFAC
jgi:hypothetical protein